MSGPPASGSTYERLLLIGRGGMGEVFLARQRGVEGFERPVALKRILPGHGSDPGHRRMFLSEARIMASLSHPNICQTVDFCSVDSDLFLVLEFLDGVTLAALMSAAGVMSTPIVGAVLLQALSGLEHAHGKGLVHRDLSPSNLFLTGDGVVKILDFGVAKVKGADQSSSGLKGKSPYMSPEQVAGKEIDERSDLFALAAVGLEALSGSPLFLRDSDYLTYQAILEGTRPVGLTTSPLDPILAQCLEVDPARRPQSARELSVALRSALANRGAEASSHDLVQYVEQHLGSELAAFRSRVAAALAADPAGPPVILHTVEMAVPLAFAPTIPSPERGLRPGSERPERKTASRPRRAAALIAALCFVVAAAALLRQHGEADRAPPAAADGGAPIAVAPAPGPVRADAAPEEPAVAVDAGVPHPAARARRTGQVSIDSSPFATLSIDGKPVGTTPLLRHPLTEGTHRVMATTADGRTRRFKIRVRAGKLTVERIDFDLGE